MAQNVVRRCIPVAGAAREATGIAAVVSGGAVAEYRIVGRGDKIDNELLFKITGLSGPDVEVDVAGVGIVAVATTPD